MEIVAIFNALGLCRAPLEIRLVISNDKWCIKIVRSKFAPGFTLENKPKGDLHPSDSINI